MAEHSNWLACALGGAAVSLLAACSTPAVEPVAQAPAQAQTTGRASERATMTGSRIPSKSTDRLLRTIGSEDVVEMERARVNPGVRGQ